MMGSRRSSGSSNGTNKSHVSSGSVEEWFHSMVGQRPDNSLSAKDAQMLEWACDRARDSVLVRAEERAVAQLIGNVGALPSAEDEAAGMSDDEIDSPLKLGMPVLVPRGSNEHLYMGIAARIFLVGPAGVAVTVLFVHDLSAWTISIDMVQPMDHSRRCVLDTWTVQGVCDFVEHAVKYPGVAIQQKLLTDLYKYASSQGGAEQGGGIPEHGVHGAGTGVLARPAAAQHKTECEEDHDMHDHR